MANQELLVLVDENDNEIGIETREKCHLGNGLRHRAYVVFLFNKGKLLLQRRSMKKLLWPGYWDVSYTSHVYPKETYLEAAFRRSKQELGSRPKKLEDVLAFTYWAPFGKYSENEYCKLLVGDFDGVIDPSQDEIMETKYVTLEQLERDIKTSGNYTPWLNLALEGFMKHARSRRYRSK